MSNKVIEVQNLTKKYDTFVALKNVSFDVYQGEIFCVVGPNGAGKTTMIECIEGIRDFKEGLIKVLNLDVTNFKRSVYKQIGVQLQESMLQNRIKVKEAVDLFSSFYDNPLDGSKILEEVGLSDHLNKHYIKLSGGQKQRLFIALALINNPKILFLDEITTGLDPHAKIQMWKTIKEIRSQNKTIFFTTHSMEEAQELSDRILILDQGKIVALNSPRSLINQLEKHRYIIVNKDQNMDTGIFENLESISKLESQKDRYLLFCDSENDVNRTIEILLKRGILYKDFKVKQPNMEDVYLSLTTQKSNKIS